MALDVIEREGGGGGVQFFVAFLRKFSFIIVGDSPRLCSAAIKTPLFFIFSLLLFVFVSNEMKFGVGVAGAPTGSPFLAVYVLPSWQAVYQPTGGSTSGKVIRRYWFACISTDEF